MSNGEWQRGDKDRRLSNGDLDHLEIEIRAEKIRVWVDGASTFLADDKNHRMLVDVMVKAMDKWLELNRRKILEKIGLYAVLAILASLLAVLGWRGWSGPR